MHNLVIWMLSLVCLAAPALGVRESNPVPALLGDISEQGFVYCVNGTLNTFNPQLASGGLTVDTLATQLYDRLLAVDPYTYRLIPNLAESWEMLDKGAIWRFRLRKYIPFQSTTWFTPGRMMNADDVVFSFQRIFDSQHPWNGVNGGHYPYFDSLQFNDIVEHVKKIDDYTVEFRLKSPDASFLWHLATQYAPVLSAEYADLLTRSGQPEQMDRKPVGTGPFMLNEYRAGQYIRLFRNDRYWKGMPHMKHVVIDLGAGGTGRLSKLLTGECDVLAWPAASQLSTLRADPRVRLTVRPGMNVAWLAFNTHRPPLDDYRVRHAIALSINNQRLMQSIYYGSGEIATSILPRASWAYDHQSKLTEHDPARAREILTQSGITQLRLTLWVPVAAQPYNPSPLKTAELLQADMAQAGIELIIVPVKGRFQETKLMQMNHDLTLSGWSTDSFDPDSFLRPLLSCAAIRSQTNYAHWCHPEFDKLLQKALLSEQLSQRVEYYQKAQAILQQQLPILPLASSLQIQAYRYDINGLIINPLGNVSFAGVFREKPREAVMRSNYEEQQSQ